MQVAGDFLTTQVGEGLYFREPKPGYRQLAIATDANHARCKDTRKSVDANAIFLWGNLIDYGAKKQGSVALSSFESELGGAARGGVRAKRILHTLVGMRILVELPVPMYIDNEGVVKALGNVTHESSAKHIETKMFWLQDEVEWGVFEPMHVLSGDNVADVQTKPLADKQFWRLMDDITGKELTEVGKRIRRGEEAYKSKKVGRPDLARPEVGLHVEIPGPDMDDYYGRADSEARSVTVVGACE